MPITKDDLLPKYSTLDSILMIGEYHEETDERRELELEMLKEKYGPEVVIYSEYNFPSGLTNPHGNAIMADPVEGRMRFLCHEMLDSITQILDSCEDTPNTPLESSEIENLEADILFMEEAFTAASNSKSLDKLPTELADDYRDYQVQHPKLFENLKQLHLEDLKKSYQEIKKLTESQLPADI